MDCGEMWIWCANEAGRGQVWNTSFIKVWLGQVDQGRETFSENLTSSHSSLQAPDLIVVLEIPRVFWSFQSFPPAFTSADTSWPLLVPLWTGFLKGVPVDSLSQCCNHLVAGTILHIAGPLPPARSFSYLWSTLVQNITWKISETKTESTLT